jgi:NADH dehydrogenase
MHMAKQVLIIGGGFAGLNVAKVLGNSPEFFVTLVDRQNYHLFQPLLYQVAMAGLSPADIAAPIRSMLSGFRNIRVLQGMAQSIACSQGTVDFDFGQLRYDDLTGFKNRFFVVLQWAWSYLTFRRGARLIVEKEWRKK